METSKPARRPRPQVMRITDAAAERVREIISNSDKQLLGVRVGVKNGGCAGMSYTMDFAEQIDRFDEVVEDKGVKIVVDPKAVHVPAGHRDGLPHREDVGRLRVQQPEPDVRLRLRRERRDHAGVRRRGLLTAAFLASGGANPPQFPCLR